MESFITKQNKTKNKTLILKHPDFPEKIQIQLKQTVEKICELCFHQIFGFEKD